MHKNVMSRIFFLVVFGSIGIVSPTYASSEDIFLGEEKVNFNDAPFVSCHYEAPDLEADKITTIFLGFARNKVQVTYGGKEFLESIKHQHSLTKKMHEENLVARMISEKNQIDAKVMGEVSHRLATCDAATDIRFESKEKILCELAFFKAGNKTTLKASVFEMKNFYVEGKKIIFLNSDPLSWLAGWSINESIPEEKPFGFGIFGNVNLNALTDNFDDNHIFIAGCKNIRFFFRNPNL